jgi:hypothetical protein
MVDRLIQYNELKAEFDAKIRTTYKSEVIKELVELITGKYSDQVLPMIKSESNVILDFKNDYDFPGVLEYSIIKDIISSISTDENAFRLHYENIIKNISPMCVTIDSGVLKYYRLEIVKAMSGYRVIISFDNYHLVRLINTISSSSICEKSISDLESLTPLIVARSEKLMLTIPALVAIDRFIMKLSNADEDNEGFIARLTVLRKMLQ